MTNQTKPPSLLTIVIGFRDRDLNRLQRCLDSLTMQTSRNFIVHLVDYGSDTGVANRAETLVKRYEFCTYTYTDTRGYPWNRSHCLNIGIRCSKSEYTMTSDIDMIYAPNFVEAALKHSLDNRVIYFHPIWLKKDTPVDLDHIDTSRLDQSKAGRGMFEANTKVLHQMRGLDEYYRYWGLEDVDLALRFEKLKLEEFWLNEHEDTYALHQWHPESGFHGDGFPREVWEHLYLYYLRRKNDDSIERNNDWGKVIAPEDRNVLEYLDFQSKSLRREKNVIYLRIPPDSHWSIGRFSDLFDEAAPGDAIAVDNAWFGNKMSRHSKVVTGFNKLLQNLTPNVRLDYAHNALHSYLALFVISARDQIKDYYLNFPASNGISIIIKK